MTCLELVCDSIFCFIFILTDWGSGTWSKPVPHRSEQGVLPCGSVGSPGGGTWSQTHGHHCTVPGIRSWLHCSKVIERSYLFLAASYCRSGLLMPCDVLLVITVLLTLTACSSTTFPPTGHYQPTTVVRPLYSVKFFLHALHWWNSQLIDVMLLWYICNCACA